MNERITMIDLHAHSIISDGVDTPIDIIRKAKEKRLKAVALTDHDSIDGLNEAETEARKLEVTFIKGIELSVAYGDNRLIHILGIGIDPEEVYFKKRYLEYRQTKHNQVDVTIKDLSDLGIQIPRSELYEISTDGFLDRQSIAKWLFKNGHTTSIAGSWAEYIDLIPYEEGELMDMPSALKMIRTAGGKSFMAHYHKPIGLLGYSEAECHDILTDLKSLGLDGLERYYPDYTEENHQVLDTYVEKYDFIISGGSDYHGSNRPGVDLGTGTGSLCVPDTLLETIL
jgi:predicted metal-dependent phosphoesterase TrpH